MGTGAKPPCAGKTALFFPAHGERADERIERETLAKAYCAVCPDDTREDCLTGALTRREPEGVWGGYNEDERKVILRNRALAAS